MLYVITTIPCHEGIYDKKEGKKETVYRILDVAIIFFLFSSSTFYTVLMQSRRSVRRALIKLPLLYPDDSSRYRTNDIGEEMESEEFLSETVC